MQAFLKRYRAKYGGEPDDMAALGYDSAKILVDAIKRAGATEGKALRDALAATKDYEGVTGKISLDAQRNATKPAVVQTITAGKFRFLETVAP